MDDQIPDFFGESLVEFAKWIARVAEAHPDATIGTYEFVLVQADYDPEKNLVEIS